MAVPTWRLALGLAKETTWGTAVVATTFLPVKKPSGFVPQYEDILDDGYRNNAGNIQAFYQGVGMTPFDTGEMLFWPDDSGHFLMGILGVDTITGAGPYTHTLTLLNTALPPSYTLTLFDNFIATARRITGAHIEEVTLKFDVKGQLKIQVKGLGKIADSVAKPTEAYSAASAFLGWQATANVGGANTKLESASITLKRPLTWIYGANAAQDATDRIVDQLDVSGSMTFAAADDTEKAYYTGNTQPASSIVFTSGTNTLTLQMTKTAFKKGGDISHGQIYGQTILPFTAITNATDAGTGNSPIKIIAVNPKSSAY